MTWDLESTWEFNPKAIDSFISDFVSTLEFADLVRGGILVGGEASGEGGNLSDEAEETPEKPDRHEAVTSPSQPLAEGIVQEHTAGVQSGAVPYSAATRGDGGVEFASPNVSCSV